jgi:hypothetical protein
VTIRTFQFAILLAAIAAWSCNSSISKNIYPKELEDHVRFLSSDELKGRMTGTEGDSLAAVYIRDRLQMAGLEPLTGDGFQRFKVSDKVAAGKRNFLSVAGQSFDPEADISPFSFSETAELASEVVFAGYGFRISNDSINWDDYRDVDVKGKWVLLLRGDPEPNLSVSGFIPFNGDRDKAMLAKDMGAAGVLMVSGPVNDNSDTFSSLSNEAWSVGIPVLRIKRNVADRILSAKGKTTAGLETEINISHKSTGFATGVEVNAGSEVTVALNATRNVVMVLNGEDENLKDEYLIIGGHYDHLGMGGSSSRAGDTVAVHHGADDNASGVAGFIEIAEKFALTDNGNRRSIIFAGFSGEESGLLGSKYFTENPPVDLSKVNAMINLDMVGRLRDSGSLQVGGIGTSPILKDLIVSLVDINSINLSLSEEGSGPSDHSAFYGKDIPVLFFTTGAHLDYHTPSDTWEKLNYQGMASVSDIIYNVAEKLANNDSKLAFTEAGPKQEAVRTMRRQGVTLGIMPDFAGNVKNGLRADLVTPGKPAALGGMKKGDIITAINGKSINNIQDYMYRMGQLKHGETISVEILRNGKKEVLLIQL